MKKILYYLSPFIIIPLLAFFMEVFDNVGFIKMSPLSLFITFIVVSAIIGNLTPAKTKFDYVMTALMPFALFCTMFVAGFLDKCDLETRFHFDRAVDAATQAPVVALYLILALTTFLASFKTVRIINIVKARAST